MLRLWLAMTARDLLQRRILGLFTNASIILIYKEYVLKANDLRKLFLDYLSLKMID